MVLQTVLCVPQCFFWHAGLQYETDEQPLHFSFPVSLQSGLAHVALELDMIWSMKRFVFDSSRLTRARGKIASYVTDDINPVNSGILWRGSFRTKPRLECTA
jgi:hypothetical protein